MRILTKFAYIILLTFSSHAIADQSNNDISFYTGQFDIKDQKGDDETSLFGLEHKNPNLFRNTFLGKFSPITGAFVTGKGASYLYTGI